MTTAIAQHLNVAESAILEVQEWAHVLWVRVRGVGARFVSKKLEKAMKPKKITYTYPSTGQSIKMLYTVKRDGYQVYVDSVYDRFIPAAALESFGAMTPEQKKSTGFEVTY